MILLKHPKFQNIKTARNLNLNKKLFQTTLNIRNLYKKVKRSTPR